MAFSLQIAARNPAGALGQGSMTTLYADNQPALQPSPSAQDSAGWLSWVRDVVLGVLGFAGLLAAAALPLIVRAWLFLPN
jgi:hypothetical protein